jgi:hypothetical protein
MTEKLLAGTMFQMNVMESFRTQRVDMIEISLRDDVKEAWISFLSEFCTLVSYEWTEYLNNVVKKETASFFGNLTTSDETFAEWTIRCKYAEVQSDTEEIKKQGKEAWLKSRNKRKRGPHDSREKINLYSQLYQKILQHRKSKVSNLEWQKLFFESYISNHGNETNEKDVLDESSRLSSIAYRIPALDGELDGFDDEPVVPIPI